MFKVIILGSGAAPGVPSISGGWGVCNPKNEKNRRSRSGTFIEYKGVRFLIDTSPDIRNQLLSSNIKEIDAVLLTHSHADHLHGIDDLREINRYMHAPLNLYGIADVIKYIHKCFQYILIKRFSLKKSQRRPELKAHTVKCNKPFYVSGVKLTPIKLVGHSVPSAGFVFDDGEIVFVSDCKALSGSAYKQIKKRPKLLILPLTTPEKNKIHMNLEELLEIVAKIDPEKVIINHMARECDYDEINRATPANIMPAYDNMVFEGK